MINTDLLQYRQFNLLFNIYILDFLFILCYTLLCGLYFGECLLFSKSIQFIFIALLISGCSTLNPAIEKQPVNFNDQVEKTEICKIIDKEEKSKGIPTGILNSIAAVESQHTAYVVNTKKKSHKFKSKAAATNFIKASVNEGCKNISVGCLQLHYKSHSNNFISISDMLTPESNVSYAARLLKGLYDKYGNWETAIKMYHTSKSKYGKIYYSKVMKKYNSIYKAS